MCLQLLASYTGISISLSVFNVSSIVSILCRNFAIFKKLITTLHLIVGLALIMFRLSNAEITRVRIGKDPLYIEIYLMYTVVWEIFDSRNILWALATQKN